jgi:hypothetical protein
VLQKNPSRKYQNDKARTNDNEIKKMMMDTPGGRALDEDTADHAVGR